MKLSLGFTKLVPSILIFVFYAASFAVLTLALKEIQLSLAYAIWSGIGTVLIVIIGILYFHEPVTALKIISISLIIAGVVGLNLSVRIIKGTRRNTIMEIRNIKLCPSTNGRFWFRARLEQF